MVKNWVSTSCKEVLSSWKESLLLLRDKRFWLVTLKASIETYSMLIKKFWWLLLICIIYDVYIRSAHIPPLLNLRIPYGGYVAEIIWFLLWSLVGFITFLIVRSSLQRKEYPYFLSYWKLFFWFVFVTGCMWYLRFIIMENANVQHYFWWLLDTSDFLFFLRMYSYSKISTLYFSPLLILYTFFYLDCTKTILCFLQRFWSAIVMIFYTYPFCFIVYIIITLSVLLMLSILNSIFFVIHGGVFASYPLICNAVCVIADDSSKLLLPFFICLFNNLYTKQVHDHYDRYA